MYTTSLLVTVLMLTSGAEDEPRPDRLPEPVSDRDYHEDGHPDPARVELGRLLFFDKILSGNRNIACASCHHPKHGTSDGVALSIGEGGQGLGPLRRSGRSMSAGVHERVPRNSPALFNLGAREFERLFHDGRVEVDRNGFYAAGFVTPAKWKLPVGLDSALAAQAMFPVTSPAEMAGQQGENEVADARAANRAAGPGGVWDILAQRLRQNREYAERFRDAFPDRVKGPGDIDFVLAANAIAAFEATAFRADQSPFDLYLRGRGSLTPEAERGLELFYGEAGCSGCHAGAFQTDHDFHSIAMPQIGPGKSDGWDASYWSQTGIRAFPEDFGRGRETARLEDRYRFRTPSLRNVALTAPYGHDGCYQTLEQVVRHHLDASGSLQRYRSRATTLPAIESWLEFSASGSHLTRHWLSKARREKFELRDTWVQQTPGLRERIASSNELPPISLDDDQISDLIAFLESLTDPRSRDLEHLIPEEVPSGLPVDD